MRGESFTSPGLYRGVLKAALVLRGEPTRFGGSTVTPRLPLAPSLLVFVHCAHVGIPDARALKRMVAVKERNKGGGTVIDANASGQHKAQHSAIGAKKFGNELQTLRYSNTVVPPCRIEV